VGRDERGGVRGSDAFALIGAERLGGAAGFRRPDIDGSGSDRFSLPEEGRTLSSALRGAAALIRSPYRSGAAAPQGGRERPPLLG